MICKLCPRECGASRENGDVGFCGQQRKARVAKIYLHPYEEPVLSGEKGSGTIFFCGCSLRCVFCQNREISHGDVEGTEYTAAELAEAMLGLQRAGAANINLVTAAHFADTVAEALESVRGDLAIPVVYNSSGYESLQTLRRLSGLIDIYMPDFKYISSELAAEYSAAPDYPEVATVAIKEMYAQVGKCVFDADGNMTRGMIVRHLVLPSCRKDSIEVLKTLARILPVEDILLSLMSQYTPDFAPADAPKNLRRRITKFEYDSVVDVAVSLGFKGFIQSHDSAKSSYTPNFRE